MMHAFARLVASYNQPMWPRAIKNCPVELADGADLIYWELECPVNPNTTDLATIFHSVGSSRVRPNTECQPSSERNLKSRLLERGD
jgi:hypothetical protein